MTELKTIESIKPGQVTALAKGQKSGLDLTLYGGRVLPQTFGQVVEFAQMMCKGGVAIPKHLRDNPGACLSVIQRSMAWEMDPWAVATKTYEVNDILAYEAQLIAAVVRKWAPVKERVINPVYTGEGETRQCAITLHHVETGEEIKYQSPMIGPDIGKVADDGSKTKSPPSNYKGIWPKNSPLWRHEPDQQLFYYSIRAMARRFFPDILLGVYDREEAYAMRDITPAEPAKVQNFLNEEEVQHGEILEPRKAATESAKPSEANGEAGGKLPAHHPETGEIIDGPQLTATEVRERTAEEVEETVITPEMMANNMVKAINGFSSKVMLEDWQNESNADINALPKPLYKVVKKALDDKHLDLLPL